MATMFVFTMWTKDDVKHPAMFNMFAMPKKYNTPTKVCEATMI